jgi:hypothetical protein
MQRKLFVNSNSLPTTLTLTTVLPPVLPTLGIIETTSSHSCSRNVALLVENSAPLLLNSTRTSPPAVIAGEEHNALLELTTRAWASFVPKRHAAASEAKKFSPYTVSDTPLIVELIDGTILDKTGSSTKANAMPLNETAPPSPLATCTAEMPCARIGEVHTIKLDEIQVTSPDS